MDLFTVDTTGENDLLYTGEYQKEIQYSARSRHNSNSIKEDKQNHIQEESGKEELPDADNLDEAEDSDEFDYEGLFR